MQHIDVMLEPLRGFMLQIGAFLPRLAIAIGILLIGWLIAKAFRLAVVKTLRALNFHVLSERAGIDGFLQQGGSRKDTTELFGWIAYALIILASLILHWQAQAKARPALRAFVAVVICCGVSTFSACSYEHFLLIPEGSSGLALLSIGINVLGCLSTFFFVASNI